MEINPGNVDIRHSRLGTHKGVQGGPQVLKIPDGPLFAIEEMPWLHSATIGFFIAQGSGFEPSNLAGITHFIEHLIFKGTKTKTPREIALAFEGVGGLLNASTGKEFMNVFGRIGGRYVRRGFTVIADMLLNPRFNESDVKKERNVILEEIRMNNDIPSQYLYEQFSTQLWGRNPIARPVAGYEKTLQKIDSGVVREYFNKRFHKSNLVISLAGNVDPESVIKWWNDISHNNNEPELKPRISAENLIQPVIPKWKRSVEVYHRDVEQATIIFGIPAPNIRDEERYPFTVLEAILGGGMGARLFQQIREKAGLTYDIDTGYSPMRGIGVMTVDSSTAPPLLLKLTEQILVELRKLRDKKAGQTELKRTKDYLEGSTYLGMESSTNRMLRNALGILYIGQIIPTEEIMQRLEKVTADDIQNCANKYFTKDKVAAAILAPEAFKENNSLKTQIEELIGNIL